MYEHEYECLSESLSEHDMATSSANSNQVNRNYLSDSLCTVQMWKYPTQEKHQEAPLRPGSSKRNAHVKNISSKDQVWHSSFLKEKEKMAGCGACLSDTEIKSYRNTSGLL